MEYYLGLANWLINYPITAMKRVVEEITELDTQIGSLFEEGAVRGPNSDSSRRAMSHNGSRIASSKYKYTPSDTESSLLNKVGVTYFEEQFCFITM